MAPTIATAATPKPEPHEIKAALAHFTGSEQFYRHGLARNVVFTEGAYYVAETCGAYWLLDEIALNNIALPELACEEFQVWKLTVTGTRGVLVCEDGNDAEVFRKEIAFTDFPLDEITFFYANKTIYLPSEH